jgi:hypothetical protein
MEISGVNFKHFQTIFKHTQEQLQKMQLYTGSPPFSEDEIQGLFQDFQGPFSVYSRTWQLEKSLKTI